MTGTQGAKAPFRARVKERAGKFLDRHKRLALLVELLRAHGWKVHRFGKPPSLASHQKVMRRFDFTTGKGLLGFGISVLRRHGGVNSIKRKLGEKEFETNYAKNYKPVNEEMTLHVARFLFGKNEGQLADAEVMKIFNGVVGGRLDEGVVREIIGNIVDRERFAATAEAQKHEGAVREEIIARTAGGEIYDDARKLLLDAVMEAMQNYGKLTEAARQIKEKPTTDLELRAASDTLSHIIVGASFAQLNYKKLQELIIKSFNS